MIKTPFLVEVRRFEQNGKKYLYDINTGFFSEIDDLFDKIVELLPDYSEDKIVERLSAQFELDEIKSYLAEIDRLNANNELFFPEFARVTKIREREQGDSVKNLWLNLIHDCNLNCIYCFGHGGSYGGPSIAMDKETAKASVDFWFKSVDKSGSKVAVNFFGGEPLLNKEVFKYTVDYIKSLFADIESEPIFQVTTNGSVLDDELLELLVENNINPYISVDGGASIQNINRPTRSGEDCFAKVVKNVTRLKEHFKAIQSRITLIKDNVPRLKQAVEELWDAGFTSVAFAEVSIEDDALSIGTEDLPLLFEQIRELTDITFENIKNGVHRVFMPVIDRCLQIHNRIIGNECSFEKTGTLIITPEGNIHKCHRLLEKEQLTVGSVFKGRDQKKMDEHLLAPMIERECGQCWARFICGGGCPEENYLYNGDFNKPYLVKCSIDKFIINEAFRLYIALYQYDYELLERAFRQDKLS